MGKIFMVLRNLERTVSLSSFKKTDDKVYLPIEHWAILHL